MRRALPTVLTVLASLSLLVADVTLYANHAIFDSSQFANRATSILGDRRASDAIGAKVADQVTRASPDTLAARSIIESVASGVVRGGAFQQLFRKAVRDLHRTAFSRDRDTLSLKVADIGVLVTQALRTLAPKVAKQIPPGLSSNLLKVSSDRQKLLKDTAQAAEDFRLIAPVTLVLAALLYAFAIALAPDRRRAVTRIAFSFVGVGAFVVVTLAVARSLVIHAVTSQDGKAVAEAAWSAFFTDLRTWNLVLAGSGVVLAAAAASLLRPVDVNASLGRAWAAIARTPERAWVRVVRALAFVAAGIVIVASRTTVLQLAALGAGLYVLYVGVAELLRMSLPQEKPLTAGQRAEGRREAAARWRSRRTAIAAAIALALIGIAIAVASATNQNERPALEIRACNGFKALCGRRLNTVAFPATHNSMSAATLPGWLNANQNDAIPDQLEGGIRGLLIDTHYGVKTPKGVYTILQRGSKSRAKLVDSLGEEFVGAAERLRRRIGYRGGGKQGVYFCHGYCEIGANPAVGVLKQIREFMVANPYEVILMSIEDDTGPRDTVKLFRDSGLVDFVYKGPLRPPWPTLRQMIRRDQRLVVMHESWDSAGPPWYHQQYRYFQETPYAFKSVRELERRASCDPYRGGTGKPLFLINNWLETSPVKPSVAAKANAYPRLLKRSRMCERIRKAFPTLVGVDLYKQGDVRGVVDTLNGVRQPGPP